MNFFSQMFARFTQQKRRSIVSPVRLNLEALEDRAVPTAGEPSMFIVAAILFLPCTLTRR